MGVATPRPSVNDAKNCAKTFEDFASTWLCRGIVTPCTVASTSAREMNSGDALARWGNSDIGWLWISGSQTITGILRAPFRVFLARLFPISFNKRGSSFNRKNRKQFNVHFEFFCSILLVYNLHCRQYTDKYVACWWACISFWILSSKKIINLLLRKKCIQMARFQLKNNRKTT